MLGHDDGVAQVEQHIERINHPLNVRRVQARDGFVENDKAGPAARSTSLDRRREF
jgi:hypothetical protein